ncbi:MAG: helix-turn-helix domain-containing protein [Bacteroidia bacterium]
MDQLINLLLTLGLVVNLIIIFSLARTRTRPKQILSLIFVCIFFAIVQDYAASNGMNSLYGLSFLVADAIGFLVGPLFWVYLKSLSPLETKPLRQHWQHFIPFGIYFLVITLPIAISYWAGGEWSLYRDFIEGYENWLQLQAVYLLGYCWLSYQLWQRYQRNIRQQYSNLHQRDLYWIKVLLIGVVITVCLNIFLAILEASGFVPAFGTAYLMTYVLIALVLYLWYYGSSQSRILLPEYLLAPPINEVAADPKQSIQHHLSNTDAAEIDALKQRLFEVIKTDRPYLKEDLSLNQLAEMMPTTDKKLSALLNHYVEQNFYDLINQYRVEEVKTRLGSPAYAHFTILGVALDCGFKSKSSFNRIFKKVTGRSPSAYKKELSQ